MSAVQYAGTTAVDPTIRDYAFALWRRRWIILGLTIAGAAIGGAVAAMMPLEYRATATLLMSPAKPGDVPAVPPSGPNFVAVLKGQGIAEDTYKSLRLGESLQATLASFSAGVVIEEVRGTNFINVHVTLRDAQLAAQAANVLAERALNVVSRLNENSAASSVREARAEVDRLLLRLQDVERRLVAFQTDAQLELRHADLNALLEERRRLSGLELDISAERERLAEAERSLTNRENAQATASSEDNRRNAAANAGSSPRDNVVTPLEEQLELRIAESRTAIAAMERRRRELVEARGLKRDRVPMLPQLYVNEMKQRSLEAEYDEAREAYARSRTALDEAELLAKPRNTYLQIADRASVPDRPLPRRIGKTILIAMVGLFLIGITVALAMELLFAGFVRRHAT